MSGIKNPTLRRRTKELTECADDAKECQLLGYELKELGSLIASMAIHMGDLQRKIDSQAEHIKDLNEKLQDRKTENSSEKPNNCERITEDGVTCAKYPACDDCLDNPSNKVKGSERLVKGSEQTDLVEDSPSLVKDLVKAFGEDGTWLERQGVYTLTLAEAKQRAVDIIESVLAKDEPTISKMEQVDKDINVRSKWETPPKFEHKGFTTTCVSVPACLLEIEDEPQTYVINPQEPTNMPKCFDCEDFFTCDGQCDEVEDEPQTDLLVKTPRKSRESHEKADAPLTGAEITELAKEIVHKMIDNSVIAEDAYPDLRQRMHEAVERLGEYYSSENERSE